MCVSVSMVYGDLNLSSVIPRLPNWRIQYPKEKGTTERNKPDIPYNFSGLRYLQILKMSKIRSQETKQESAG